MKSKKFIAALVLALLVMVPAGVLAYGHEYPANSEAKLVGGVNCKIVIGGDGKQYPHECTRSINRFVDGNNVCYTFDNSISCVKK